MFLLVRLSKPPLVDYPLRKRSVILFVPVMIVMQFVLLIVKVKRNAVLSRSKLANAVRARPWTAWGQLRLSRLPNTTVTVSPRELEVVQV